MATAAPVTEEEIRCPVCFETFDTEIHEPKRLMCPHSVCATCVKRLPQPIKCPVCKREVTVPLDDLARDIVTLRLLQSHTCSECDKLGELRTCKRCKIRLCEMCETRHRTPHHCQISLNVKAIGEKLGTEAVKKVMSKKASSVEATKKNIDEVFEEIEAAVAARKQYIHTVAKDACKLDDETLKIQSAPEVLTRATQLLEAKQTQNQKLKKLLKETEDLKRLMSDPPAVVQPEELVEKLRMDAEKLKSEVEKLGESVGVTSGMVNEVANVPDYKAKRRVKRVIELGSDIEKASGCQKSLPSVLSMTEDPETGRMFVSCGVHDLNFLDVHYSQVIVMYNNGKFTKMIEMTRGQPVKLLFVHGGGLYVVSTADLYTGRRHHLISSFDPQTLNKLNEHNLNTDGDAYQFCASKNGCTLFGKSEKKCYDDDHHEINVRHNGVIVEFSLTGERLKRIEIINSPVPFLELGNLTVSSTKFLFSSEDSVYIFSNTGHYESHQSWSRIYDMVTDHQDNVLTLVNIIELGQGRREVVTVHDINLRVITIIDLTALGIGNGEKICTTTTGDIIVAGSEDTNEFASPNELFIM